MLLVTGIILLYHIVSYICGVKGYSPFHEEHVEQVSFKVLYVDNLVTELSLGSRKSVRTV